MLTIPAHKLSPKRLTAFLAVLSVVTIVGPTFWAFHQECLPRQPQCMTARQECQALGDNSSSQVVRSPVSVNVKRGIKQKGFP
jgi:hypothetical protein